MAAVHVLRSALFRAPGVDERRRLARGHRGLHLGPRHHLELDKIFSPGLRLRERGGRRQRDDCDGSEYAVLHSGSFIYLFRVMTIRSRL